jgi:hypothetical protein
VTGQLVELRIAGFLVALLIALFALARYRQGEAGKTTLAVGLIAGLALGSVAIEPQLVFAIRDLLGVQQAPLSGLVIALIGAVIAQFLLLITNSVRIDETHRRLTRLVTALSAQSLEVPPDAPRPAIAVVMPALNEAENLDVLLHRIPRQIQGLAVLPIVVDDGSTDATRDVCRREGAAVVTHPVNQGGGAALRLGYQVAADLGASVVVTMDADGQHDPAELERLLDPVLSDRADFVIGSRLKGEHEAASLIRHLGIYLFNALISILAGKKITDCSSGYRAFRTSALMNLHLAEDQFHTSETILAAVKAGLRVEEVGITIRRRYSGRSKKPPALRYGWGFLRAIFKTWWR